MTTTLRDARIPLLAQAIEKLKAYGRLNAVDIRGSDRAQESKQQTVSWINRNLLAIERAVDDVPLGRHVTLRHPATTGGGQQNIDLLSNIFGEVYGRRFIDDVIALLERALGAYESSFTGLTEVGQGTREEEGQTMNATGIQVFVSHRATDAELAEGLVKCLEGCLEIPDGTIRCTSVTGYRLDVGDDGPAVLRSNLKGCKLVIGLLTEQSLESAFVIMELGAAWAFEKRTCPILSPEVPFAAIPAAIGGTHAIRTTDPDEIMNLVEVIARETGFSKRNMSSINKAVRTFVARATELAAAAIKIASDDAEPRPIAASDEEAFVRLKSWVKNVGLMRMEQEIVFARIDNELRLASGMTAKHIINAAREFFDVDVKSKESILFKRKPQEIAQIGDTRIDPYRGV
jgi:hypothetical protein